MIHKLDLWYSRLHPGAAALLETCVLFLPAIPAYIWVWPVLSGMPGRLANILTYAYVLAGTLYIGLRRWNLEALGLNRKGFWFSLAFGAALILGRSLVILSVNWGLPLIQYTPVGLLGEFLFYFALVGLVEELLFRGLVYRALLDWMGVRWAIWGSSVGFVLWHIFGQGPLVGAAMLLYGLIFALMRWRAGGILGLILVHGAIGFLAALMLPDIDVVSLGRPAVPYPAMLLLGLGLILLVPSVLWKFDLLVRRFPSHRLSSGG